MDLHFVVIGAQKSGTTSLHQYLNAHPEICVPTGKEALFFSDDERYSSGWNAFASEFFECSEGEHILGKVTPSYMVDPVAGPRLIERFPGTRVIAILRNPLERARSQHQMTVRRGIEDRSFTEAVAELQEPEAAVHARTLRPGYQRERGCYLAWSEYDRLLRSYDHYFEHGRALVLFTEELARDPKVVFQRLLEFVGADASFLPDNLGQRYHQGGAGRKIPIPEWLLRSTMTRAMGRMVPASTRRRIIYWLNYHNVRKGAERQPLGHDTTDALVSFFRRDVAELERRIGRPVPWSEFH